MGPSSPALHPEPAGAVERIATVISTAREIIDVETALDGFHHIAGSTVVSGQCRAPEIDPLLRSGALEIGAALLDDTRSVFQIHAGVGPFSASRELVGVEIDLHQSAAETGAIGRQIPRTKRRSRRPRCEVAGSSRSLRPEREAPTALA